MKNNSFIKVNEFIDNTLLRADSTKQEISELCEEAKKFSFKSVCVNPSFVQFAKKKLDKTNVKVCTVISFPLGSSTKKTKIFETINAIENGADEIDMVANISCIKDHDYEYVEDEIKEILKIVKKENKILKVIIETCLLTKEEIIEVSLIYKKIKVNFVKTSTGFSKKGATVEDVALIKKVIGNKIGVKASGGIRTHDEAIAMINAGASRIGTSKGVDIIKGCKK